LADTEESADHRMRELVKYWQSAEFSTLEVEHIIGCVEIHPESATMNAWHGHLIITFNRRFTPTAAAKRMIT